LQSSKNLEEAFKEAIEVAKSLPRPEIGDDMIIAYSGGGKPPALNLYIALVQAGVRATLAPASLVATSILPYRETGPVIAFTNSGRDARAVNVMMASSGLGLRAYLVSPPLHPAVEDLVYSLDVDLIVVEGRVSLLTMMIASLFWRPRLMGAREARVKSEVEALPDAYEWVSERFGGVLAEASANPPSRVYYSSLLEASANYYTVISQTPSYELEASLSLEERGSRPLVLLSSVEAHNYKDVLLGLSMKGVRPIKAEINTDPVTANIYGALIAAVISGKLS